MSKTRIASAYRKQADILPALIEVFRENGFEGTSLSLISQHTGLGKGSLYHFFPGGKEEMAAAVLAEVDGWFQNRVFRPLREARDPRQAINAMLESVDEYFQSGQRACLVGIFSLDQARDLFPTQIRSYFAVWQDTLQNTLSRLGHTPETAAALSEQALIEIQGALVLAQALDDTACFERALARLGERLIP